MSTLISASAGSPFLAAFSNASATAPLIRFAVFPNVKNKIRRMQSSPETYSPFWMLLGRGVAPVDTMEKRAKF